MKSRTYALRVRGLDSRDGEIRWTALEEVLGRLRRVADRVTRLRATGVSTAGGPRPKWLEQTLDFTITGLSAGSTTLGCRAPCLRETARDQFGRLTLSSDQPPPDLDDTSLDLVGEAIRALTREDGSEAASDGYYDRPVIEAMVDFGRVCGAPGVGYTLARDDEAGHGFEWNDGVRARAEQQLEQLPSAQAYVVSGRLDRIQHADGRFRMRLKDGRSLPGHLDRGEVEVEALRPLWGRDVTVTGMVHFRSNGTPRTIVARHLMPYNNEADDAFDPLPRSVAPGASAMAPEVDGHSGDFDWDSIRGAWPGDETIEELLDQLDEIRSPR